MFGLELSFFENIAEISANMVMSREMDKARQLVGAFTPAVEDATAFTCPLLETTADCVAHGGVCTRLGWGGSCPRHRLGSCDGLLGNACCGDTAVAGFYAAEYQCTAPWQGCGEGWVRPADKKHHPGCKYCITGCCIRPMPLELTEDSEEWTIVDH